MLSYEEFAKEDFYTRRNYLRSYHPIKSQLIYGKERFSRFAIVIPTYKRASLLKEALESCFQQRDSDITIIVSDNNTERNDETEKLIREIDDHRILYYKNQENMGPLANFNRCIELANCEYCVFLCSDDLLDSQYLQKVSTFLERHPDSDMILPAKDIVYPKRTYHMGGYSSVLRMAERIFKKSVCLRLSPKDFMIYYPAGGPSGIVYKKSSFIDIGGFNPRWHPTGDNILHIFMTTLKNVYLWSENSGQYRMLDNISSEKDMPKIYLLQNYLFRMAFLHKFNTGYWVKNFYKGNIYYRTKADRMGVYPKEEIREVVGKVHFLHYLFFLCTWCISFIGLPFRIRRC